MGYLLNNSCHIARCKAKKLAHCIYNDFSYQPKVVVFNHIQSVLLKLSVCQNHTTFKSFDINIKLKHERSKYANTHIDLISMPLKWQSEQKVILWFLWREKILEKIPRFFIVIRCQIFLCKYITKGKTNNARVQVWGPLSIQRWKKFPSKMIAEYNSHLHCSILITQKRITPAS